MSRWVVPTPGHRAPCSPLTSVALRLQSAGKKINALWTADAFEPAQSHRMKEVPFKGLFPRPMTRRWLLKVACLLCSGHTPNCHFLFATPAARPANICRGTFWNGPQTDYKRPAQRRKTILIVLPGHVTSQMFPLACTEPTPDGAICGSSVHFLSGPSLFFSLRAGPKLKTK